jgi:hypothetical protein
MPDGSTRLLRLNEKQYLTFMLLRDAGRDDKQLLTFVSGPGGVGKSTVTELLIAQWRSDGLVVLVTAASAKAARLIGGVTVHKMFRLHQRSGLFMRAQLEGEKGSAHFQLLARADIVVIDEISMLSADTLHGVDEALSFAVRYAAGLTGHMSFGRKSILASGDLYQLPAVERHFYEEQVYLSPVWGEFHLLQLTEIVRVRSDERAFLGLLARARLGWEHLTEADVTLLRTRLCSQHNSAGCCTFRDVMLLRPAGGHVQTRAPLTVRAASRDPRRRVSWLSSFPLKLATCCPSTGARARPKAQLCSERLPRQRAQVGSRAAVKAEQSSTSVLLLA